MTETFSAASTADEMLSGVDLKGKRFLVTGASSALRREGHRAQRDLFTILLLVIPAKAGIS